MSEPKYHQALTANRKLLEENARLKAEAERSRDQYNGIIDTQLESIARLKAEVERLNAFCTRTIIPNEELQAQVERLRKAGDEMVQLLDHMDVVMDMNSDHPEVEAWNAAKEGKQLP